MSARRSLAGASRFGASDDSLQGLEERLVLAVDCSGPWCAAAVLFSNKVILRQEPMEKGQAERLLPLLQEILAESGVGFADLRGIAKEVRNVGMQTRDATGEVADLRVDGFCPMHDWRPVASIAPPRSATAAISIH